MLVVLAAAVGVAAGDEAPAAPRKKLPSLGGAGAPATVRVQGEIKQSTRGRGSGPVRLDVQSDDGAPIAILLVPDASLDTLGLSLKTGERIDARGAMVSGKKPLLVATEVTVAGQVIRLRDGGPNQAGGLVPPAASGSPRGVEAPP